ncbi:MAG: T9SS type A sorting domain-containing protein [Candidatus Cloacimonetes bacterium]|nr:T9SS type A sorting domain-containing protein [Candidatus Cloacimonadota bacterium]
MKKILFVCCLLLCTLLFGLEITTSNSAPEISVDRGFTTVSSEDSFFPQNEGEPAVPVSSIFFEIPVDKKILNVNFEGRNENHIILNSLLTPVQRNVPFSYKGEVPFIAEYREQGQGRGGVFPENLIHNFGSGRCGNTNLGYISFFTGTYKPTQNEFTYYEEITFDIEFENDPVNEIYRSNYTSKQVLKSLNIPSNSRTTDIKYLLITPESFVDEYETLLDFRRIQGVETFIETVENIEQNFQGIDLQEKIRNCIISKYNELSISFVTLGADTDAIPSRTAFAFDCEYGLYDDENDLRADMYYSCLNGNWNADGDEIYGEEEDEVDFFPEVFVGRISANTADGVIDYISRLIAYEKGEHEDYTKAGGLSMELWQGSDSEVCQQFIYEQYFPEYYDITFLYDDENTMENAYALLNQNMNIVQHTGHAGKTALSLEDGSIRTTNLYNLENEYGGIFYSIGCWSAALDYGSIGEALVMKEDKGQLAYIGNSRYGWGAPAASGFGFSEFFQKEFFKQIFWNDISIISETNALQKLPFIPYFGGTSVYKWVAYQLNEVGDSYFNLINENPKELDYNIEISEDLHFVVTSNGIPIEDVIITVGEDQSITNANGETIILNSDETAYLYKYGYKTVEINLSEYQPTPFIGDISGNTLVSQGQTFWISSVLHNPTNENFNFLVEYEFDEDEISISNTSYTSSIEANSNIDLNSITGHILLIDESYQMEKGKEITVTQNIYNENLELVTESTLIFTILAPDVSLNFVVNPENISPGSNALLNYEFINSGDFTLDYLNINFVSGSEYFTFEETEAMFEYPIMTGETVALENWIITVSEDTPTDYVGSYTIEFQVCINWGTYEFTFSEEIILPIGILSWSDDFEEGLNWDCPTEWQIVQTYAYNGESSFSCRPSETGTYTAIAPSFVYTQDLELSFNYKFKMPMYGNDGVFFILEYNDVVDTLIFLGAGGALPNDNGRLRTPEIYIEGDWVEYNLDLDELMLDELEIGTVMTFKLKFNYAEEIINFNQYGSMSEIGVFIDDFSLGEGTQVDDEPEFEPGVLYAFPNPVYSGEILNIAFSASNQPDFSVRIYNIKGQFVKEIDGGNNQDNMVYWFLKDENNKRVSSGLYFIKVKSGNIILTKKVMLIH